MNTYEYNLNLTVKVTAFDEHDAADMISDAFGIGENCGTEIIESQVSALGIPTE